MKIYSFAFFEKLSNGKAGFKYDELSDEAKSNAIENVREKMWEGDYGAHDIPEWVIDDDYIFEPPTSELIEVFGPNYEDDLGNSPMIANDRDNISYAAKDDRNYYLHCSKALNVTNSDMFLGWLGISPMFWEDVNYYFTDSGTYTKIEFEIENEDEISEEERKLLDGELDRAEKNFETHMSRVLDLVTRSIEYEYEDAAIEQRIESNNILFDEEGNPID